MFDLLILLSLVILWFVVWSILEKRHFKSIEEREVKYKEIIQITKTDSKKMKIENGELLSWNVVISIDFFKKFIASFINFFGWRLFVYESLLDRARREAILRIKEEAHKKWYNCLANLKIETSSISKWKKWSIGSVEILAYATAVNLNN